MTGSSSKVIAAISIVIPTINRYNDLSNTLVDLSRQTVQNYEIILIDQTPHGAPLPSWEKDSRIRYYYSDIPSASAARNLGLQLARCSVVLFLDDDVVIKRKEFLANHLRHYVHPEVSGVAGGVHTASTPNKLPNLPRLSRLPEIGWLFFPGNYDKPCRVRNGASSNLSVRRDWARAIGGMDEHFVKGAHREESNFNVRYTARFGPLVFDPEADLFHIGNPNGGIRNWDIDKLVKAQQHFDGALYFALCTPHLKWRPLYIAETLWYFILKKPILLQPRAIKIALKRFWRGWRNAHRMANEGPRYAFYTKPDGN